MSSIVQICNMALTRIGQSQLIDSISEQSKAAELCALHYETCRDQVLQDFPWSFAEARVYLADIGAPPMNWAYRYRYPADCLQARYLAIPGQPMPSADYRVPFQVIHAQGGRAIVSNAAEAELVYTVRLDDTTYFTPAFTDALSWRLAAELAIGLTAKPDGYAAAYRNYQIAISKAQALAFEEGEQGSDPVNEFVRARS
jgi:hypothetical protein